jgi:hypothetical protein
MERIIVTKEELQKLINEAISNSDELDGDVSKASAGDVTGPIESTDGCNWRIIFVRNAGSKEVREAVVRIIESFRQQYNLEDQ